MNIVNCTPHEINVYAENECLFDAKTKSYHPITENPRVITIPVSGIIPRCTQTDELKAVVDNIPLCKTVFGEVENLPEEQPHTYYIVSQIVLNAAKSRKDLIVPVGMVRNSEGKIIGCLRFAINE